MEKIYDNLSQSIGNTPLIRINHFDTGNARLLIKQESRNPLGSIKCRVGNALIEQAEKQNLLKAGMKIVEPTSGNTGIALAFIAAIKGYQITLTMPESMSLERRKILSFLGAQIILTPAAQGMTGAVMEAQKIVNSAHHKWYMPQQFKNPANPAIHKKTTGPEIMRDTNGKVDYIISAVGTGGTLSGIADFFKNEIQHPIHMVAVEPEESPVISQTIAHQKPTPAPHQIQGIGAGFIPETLHLEWIDSVEKITSQEAIEMSNELARKEGILCGISSGAAFAAGLKVCQRAEAKNKTIVVILPDSGERYLSSLLFEKIHV